MRKRKWLLLFSELAEPCSPIMEPNLARALENEESRFGIARAVSRLTPKQRAVIQLQYGLDGDRPLCETELCARLGISKVAVQGLHRSAKLRLRRDEPQLRLLFDGESDE